jgi:RNA polymerase sigma factor (sigma-70 family)
MTTTTTPAQEAESDPVTAALADTTVRERLFNQAMASLSRSCAHFTRTRRVAEAEEIVSRATVAALRNRDNYDSTRDVVNWLLGFVRNCTREHARVLARTHTGPPPDGPPLEELISAREQAIQDQLAIREQADKLLATLSPEDATIIKARCYDDKSFDEIAAELGTNANAIRVRHHRILAKLRSANATNEEGQP